PLFVTAIEEAVSRLAPSSVAGRRARLLISVDPSGARLFSTQTAPLPTPPLSVQIFLCGLQALVLQLGPPGRHADGAGLYRTIPRRPTTHLGWYFMGREY
ncbi:unnamed protein product, partial [Pleuronectes platessa]